MEKHFVSSKTILKEWQHKLCIELEKWMDDFTKCNKERYFYDFVHKAVCINRSNISVQVSANWMYLLATVVIQLLPLFYKQLQKKIYY